MIELHYYPGNASLIPHIILRELELPFALRLVNRSVHAQHSPEYRQLNPHGKIPTLVDGDLVLWETAAITLHLLDKKQPNHLLPSGPARANFLKWLIWLATTPQAESLLYFYPERWAEGACAGQVKASAERRIGEMMDLIERELAPYLLGSSLSAVDLYLLVLCRWTRGMANPARNRPKIGRLLAELIARPAVRAAFEAEGIGPPLY
jgi:glutathione S-transferase